MFVKICAKCEKEFETRKDDEDVTCYTCTLIELSGGCPEGSDFATARMLSGTWTEREEEDFWEEARALDHGSRCTDDDYYDERYDYEPEPLEHDDQNYCRCCDAPIAGDLFVCERCDEEMRPKCILCNDSPIDHSDFCEAHAAEEAARDAEREAEERRWEEREYEMWRELTLGYFLEFRLLDSHWWRYCLRELKGWLGQKIASIKLRMRR